MNNLLPLQIASAELHLGHELDGWTLHEAHAPSWRSFEYTVSFAQSFSAAPVVHLGMTGFDISNESASRVHVRLVEATASGFTLRVETWLHTRVWSVSVSWLAIGS